MATQNSITRRPKRLLKGITAAVVGGALVAATLPGAARAATPAEAVAPQPGSYLDHVEKRLREVSPGFEGTAWERSANTLPGLDGDDDWLLPSIDCFDLPAAECDITEVKDKYLGTIRDNIAEAEQVVDISTLGFPDGEFVDAIADGLAAAIEDGNEVEVRLLGGAPPAMMLTENPRDLRQAIEERAGGASENLQLSVASVTTSKMAMSWNHSKIIAVDGETAIVGGQNMYGDKYIDTPNPVHDLTMQLNGPAARQAQVFLDELWGFTCDNRWNPWYVYLSRSDSVTGCPREFTSGLSGSVGGDVDVISVGKLGNGISGRDPESAWTGDFVDILDANDGLLLGDYSNSDADYDTRNPSEAAQRALIEAATESIFISQQDVIGIGGSVRYDARLYETLAQKVVDGVDVTIAVSEPMANSPGSSISNGYSQIASLDEIADPLLARIERITGDAGEARVLAAENLNIAPFRFGPDDTWQTGEPIRNHSKLVFVDDAAFYIGSNNLYPSWLQEFGYIVEDHRAAAALAATYVNPLRQYSLPEAFAF